MTEKRTCVGCGKSKPLSEYSKRSDNGLYRRECKACRAKKTHAKYMAKRAIVLQERAEYERLHPKVEPTTKVCRVCGQEKPIDEFLLRKDGYRRGECDECRKANLRAYHEANKDELNAKNRVYGKRYRIENAEKAHLSSKRYYEANKERIQERHRKNGIAYYYKHRERELERHRIYNKENRDKINERTRRYEKERRAKDPLFRLRKQLRTLVNSGLSRKGYKKNTKTEQLVGCSADELITHLLATYKATYGVEWDGKEPVHIDHIKPLSGMSESELLKAQHYTNLQLLKAHDNLVKHDSLEWSLDKNNKEGKRND